MKQAYAVFGILALVFSATSAAAQRAPRGRIPVEVIVTQADSASGAVATRAQTGRKSYTILIAHQDATPELLAAAAIDVTILMERDGDAARDQKMFRVGSPASAPANEIRAASSVLASIMQSAEVDVPGVGRARVGEMYLPNQASRQKARQLGKLRFAQDTTSVVP